MNTAAFLKELSLYFPIKRSEEDTPRLLNGYASDIDSIIKQYGSDCYCDFQQVLFDIRTKYKYANFPSMAELAEYIPRRILRRQIEPSYSGNEGNRIKRVVNGYPYEFVIVPNHWQGIKTVSQLDTDIARKRAKAV